MPFDIKLALNFKYQPVNISLNYKPILETPIDITRTVRKNRKKNAVEWEVESSDMCAEIIEKVKNTAEAALEKYDRHSDIAAFIKKEFDQKFGNTWHCIVGRNFGAYVRPTMNHFICFNIGQVAVLLFKSG